jgi:Insertion element 4 transposase N-terminal
MSVTRTITVAAGAFAPGHLGELTRIVPFELADAVLEEVPGARERRIWLLPSRAGLYFLLAMCLFPRVGYLGVWGKLTAALDGLGLAVPSPKALRDRRRIGIVPVRRVLLQKTASDPDLRVHRAFHAARWYSLITPPSCGAENLCHQAIFVNHAAEAVTPLNPEMIQVGDAVEQRAQWRGLLEGSVRPVGIVNVLVLPQHHHQVPLVPDQGPVQQLTLAAANPPLHDRIHPRRLNRGAGNPDASGLEDGVERGGEAGVPVMRHELHPCLGILQVHEQVPGLLDNPGLDRMPRNAQDPDAPAAVLDRRKDVRLRAIEQVSGEEVQRQDPLRLG